VPCSTLRPRTGTGPPASLTELISLYGTFAALDAGKLAPDEPVTVCALAAGQQPVRLNLRTGQTLTVVATVSAVARARRELRRVISVGQPVHVQRKPTNGTSWKAVVVGLRQEQRRRACKHLWPLGITWVARSPRLMQHPFHARR
jgi:hypothetical protein